MNATQQLLTEHFARYPKASIQDAYKFLYQSAFGCEHLLSDEKRALAMIQEEFERTDTYSMGLTEPLDGPYCRVSLEWLKKGLKAQTLTRLFMLSAQESTKDTRLFAEKLADFQALAEDGRLALSRDEVKNMLGAMEKKEFPPCHHSETFREAYHPAYRVIRREYARFLPLFVRLDTSPKPLTFALEGGSASGKTTFSRLLEKLYDCNIFHMDDFFLQPHQRTPQRFAQAGGNIDWERFRETVLIPLKAGKAVAYQRFDCHSLRLLEPIPMAPKAINLAEGVYSLHPMLREYYDFAVFLDIDPALQRARVEKRNTPEIAGRYFSTWIPLENRYFEEMDIEKTADLVIPAEETPETYYQSLQ